VTSPVAPVRAPRGRGRRRSRAFPAPGHGLVPAHSAAGSLASLIIEPGRGGQGGSAGPIVLMGTRYFIPARVDAERLPSHPRGVRERDFLQGGPAEPLSHTATEARRRGEPLVSSLCPGGSVGSPGGGRIERPAMRIRYRRSVRTGDRRGLGNAFLGRCRLDVLGRQIRSHLPFLSYAGPLGPEVPSAVPPSPGEWMYAAASSLHGSARAGGSWLHGEPVPASVRLPPGAPGSDGPPSR
jgi:hypothetical protein